MTESFTEITFWSMFTFRKFGPHGWNLDVGLCRKLGGIIRWVKTHELVVQTSGMDSPE